jgi:hypothetical protein
MAEVCIRSLKLNCCDYSLSKFWNSLRENQCRPLQLGKRGKNSIEFSRIVARSAASHGIRAKQSAYPGAS